MLRVAVIAWSAWIVVGATACSGASNSGPPLTVDEYLAAARDAMCNRFVQCGEIESLDVCKATGLSELNSLPAIASVRAAFATGRATFDGNKARACVDALVAQGCDNEAAASRATPRVCLQVARGTVPMNQPCAVNEECVTQFCSPVDATCDQGCCLGSCGIDVPLNGGEGEMCVFFTCGDGLYCDQEVDYKCRRLLPAGAHCSRATTARSYEECDYGYMCRLDSPSSGTCVPVPGLGEPCTSICRDVGTVCHPTARICVPVSKAGDSCAQGQYSPLCGSFNQCDASGHCAPPAPVGAPCTSLCPSPNQYCAPAAGTTSTRTCQLLADDGEPCDADVHCASGHCDTTAGTCVPGNACL